MRNRLAGCAFVAVASTLALAWPSADDSVQAEPATVSAGRSGDVVPDDGCVLGPSPRDPASDSDRIRNQNLLDEATAPVDQDAPGFAEIRYDVGAGIAEIAWRGTRPEALTRLAGRHASGVTVCIVSVPYGQGDVISAMNRARAVDRSLPAPVTKYPAAGYDGIVAGFHAADFGRVNNDHVIAQYRESAGMPVEFTVASRSIKRR